MEYLMTTALKKGYAVNAFNFANLEVLKAILKANEEAKAPVIAQMSESAIKFIGPEYLKGIIAAARKEAKYPISFHLDHGKDLDAVKLAIEIGCDSVMIDASSYEYEENVRITKEVVDYAHSKNVWVEAELGALSGIEDEVNVDESKSSYTNPEQAKDFVTRTGIDSLAVAIGTSHGAYKFKGDAELKFDILDAIEKEIPNTPLVLHGASSVEQKYVDKFCALGGDIKGAKGVTAEILNKASKRHVCKINVDTDLRIAYTSSILEHIKNNPQNIDYRKYLGYAIDEVKDLMIEKIKNLGSYNQG